MRAHIRSTPKTPLHTRHLHRTLTMAAQPSEFVTLVSSDGYEYIIRRKSAYVAGTIKRMLDPTSACAPRPWLGAAGSADGRRCR
jgi:hypothetical protein